MKAVLQTLILLFAVVNFSSQSHADFASQEGAALQRLIGELDYLIAETGKVEARSRTGQVSFNYRALVEDLIKMRNLIVDHIRIANSQPNSIPPAADFNSPVRGTYLLLNNNKD